MYTSPSTSARCYEIGGAKTTAPSLWRPEPTSNAYLRPLDVCSRVASAENAQSNVRENTGTGVTVKSSWLDVASCRFSASTKDTSCVSSRRACPQTAPRQEPFNGEQQPLARVLDRSYPVAIAPGSRVTLHDVPSPLTAFEETDAYVLDYPIAYYARVRTTVCGKSFRHNHGDLVDQLLAVPAKRDEDTLILHTSSLRRCPVVGEGQIKLYDRVETKHDILPYRSGRIEQLIDDDDDDPSTAVRDARDGSILHLRMRDTQKQFIPGDVVRVVGGFYAGCRAIVKKTVSLVTQFGETVASVGAFELRLTDNGENEKHKSGYKRVLVIRQHVDFLPAQAATAQPTGPTHQSVGQTWLCSPQLVLKRIDVRVVPPKRSDNCNNILASSVGKTGFIELESALTPQQLRLRLDVHMDDGTRRVGILAIQLQPIDAHYVPMDAQLPRLGHAAPRVIVIGPDL
ncbi:hypothetical protein C8F01DRAFT_1151462 [Mycena amicta]|nr:hypothetical protein C8F01DRAFT_1151462 [Mycena amicta]